MSVDVKMIRCQSCAAPQAIGARVCEYCGSPLYITTINDSAALKVAKEYSDKITVEKDDEMISKMQKTIGIVYSTIKNYGKAAKFFDQAIESCMDDPEPYFYIAANLLKGKKPFSVPKAVVDEAIANLDSACELENRGIFYYFQAYLAYDHHFRKKYRSPDYRKYLQKAAEVGTAYGDAINLFALLGVDMPAALDIF